MATTAEHPTPTTAAHPARRRRRSPAGAFWAFWGALALMLLFGWLIWRLVRPSEFKDVDARRADERTKIYNDVAAASEKALRDPASWLNKEKGTVRLPIDQAVRLTLGELKNSQPRAAYPLTQSPPVPNPPPATSATAPAAGQPAATTPATTNANNPVLPNQNTAPAAPIQPDKPNPSSGAVQGPTPGGNPPPGTVPAPTPAPPQQQQKPQEQQIGADGSPTPAPTPEVAIPASHLQPSPTPH